MSGQLITGRGRGRTESAAAQIEAPARRLLSFGILHAGNTLLNMGFTLLQLLVLAHILPLPRYSEVVFLTSVGFYLQPLDQALGKANFVALRAVVGRGGAPALREVVGALCGQGLLLLATAISVPCALEPIGSQPWIEDTLFLSLSLATNFWAFDLQSTAWALDRNLPFVTLAIVHRSVHFAALALAFAVGSFLLFGVVASCATLLAMTLVIRMFISAGLFRATTRLSDWPDYLRKFGVSLLATLTDLIVLNAPYAVIAARFGIGPMLVVFDTVMKLARIAMAGARTLSEIALSRHSALVAAGDLGAAHRLFLLVLGTCVGATLGPALLLVVAGRMVFHLLLGANDVIPAAAMIPAALVVLASALYQPALFFLSFSNRRRPVQTLGCCAAAALAVFSTAVVALPLQPAAMLGVFGVTFLAVAVAAERLTNRLFHLQGAGARDGETIVEASLAAEPTM